MRESPLEVLTGAAVVLVAGGFLLYAAQAKESSNSSIAPPLFVLFVNDPRLLPESYQHYLCARIREQWEYPGLPILMRLRGREGINHDINE